MCNGNSDSDILELHIAYTVPSGVIKPKSMFFPTEWNKNNHMSIAMFEYHRVTNAIDTLTVCTSRVAQQIWIYIFVVHSVHIFAV